MTSFQQKKGKADFADVVIGANLKSLRIMQGLSQQQLGQKLGITFQQIQKYESGVNRISAARLLEISKVLEVEIHLLFGSLCKQDAQVAEYIDPKLLELLGLLRQMDNQDLIKNLSKIVRTISNAKIATTQS